MTVYQCSNVPICESCLEGEGTRCLEGRCIYYLTQGPEVRIRTTILRAGCKIDPLDYVPPVGKIANQRWFRARHLMSWIDRLAGRK